jgi:HNH endonuclease
MCRYCTIRPKWRNIEIDHVWPVISGGKSTMENCVTACRTCNQKKGWSLRWVPIPLHKMPAVPPVDALATGPAKKSNKTAAKPKHQTEKWKKRLAERERRFAAGEPLWDFERM